MTKTINFLEIDRQNLQTPSKDASTTVTSTDVRKFFKALSNDPKLLASIRNAKSIEDKQQIVESAGYKAPTFDAFQALLASSVTHPASGRAASPEDLEFLDCLLHLASGSVFAPG